MDQAPEPPIPPPIKRTPEEWRERELAGGTIIVGRPAFKEYMAGLRQGWTRPLERRDDEEQIAQELSEDGVFDEPEEDDPTGEGLEGEPIPTLSRLPPSSNTIGSPFQNALRNSPPSSSRNVPSQEPAPSSTPQHQLPSAIPIQPPLLLVSFTDLIGVTRIPFMIVSFFNRRAFVRQGAEDALALIQGQTRSFHGPSNSVEKPPSFSQAITSSESADDAPAEPLQTGDLAFGADAESYYKPKPSDIPTELDKARDAYYKALPAKLKTARELVRGTREPTKNEDAHPPPTEMELRAERVKKELRWRREREGWELVRQDRGVQWDERFREALRVFTKPENGSDEP